MARFYQSEWCHKVTALVIAMAYFVLLIFINNTSYVWATIALAIILFVATVACAKQDSPLLIQIRNARRTTTTQNGPGESGDHRTTPTGETRIWMSDVPPSYSFVMSAEGPPTPPPSYGSAILMFPPPYSSSPGGRPPMSISAQVSVCGGSAPGTPQPSTARFTFSTQFSLVEPLADTVSLRTRLFLSRQVSNEENGSDVFLDTLQLRTKLFLSSREDLTSSENEHPADTELHTVAAPSHTSEIPIQIHAIEVPLVVVTDEAGNPLQPTLDEKKDN